jgi:asparagine synthase (glutamine-hydrolysing)
MPGIVGLISKKPRECAEQELRRMVAAIRHESFYDVGTCVDESLGVYVGWAARKGSFSDGAPLCNERGDVSLTFSGEEFSAPENISRLRQQGHAFETTGPAYLVHLYEEDPTFPACLNGRFHGLLADQRNGTATLFNDRYGMHRIYYHEAKDAFYFAAEAKAILAVRPELRKADPRGLGELVSCGCVLENRTIFEGIQVLPAGSAWDFRNGALERKACYFQPQEWEQQEQLDSETYYRQLREIFSRILPRYFAGAEKTGISLTGGLDSRMIMAWQESSPGSLPCYSFGGTYRDCQDVVIARRVAKACGQTHQVIPVGEEFLSNFPRYAERTVYLTDGCVDLSHSPDLFVNERARQIAPARMTGNYGGEVLRRVRAFKAGSPLAGLFRPELEPYFKQAKATYDGVIQTHPLSFAVFRQAPWHHYGLLSLEQTQVALRSPFLDNEFVKTVFQAPDSACRDNEVSLRLIADGNSALRNIRTDRGLAGNQNAFVSAWNHQFYEFTYKAEYAYDYGMPQWVAKVDHLLSPLHLERLFLGRQKFYHFRIWYRDRLAKYVREMLLDPKTLSRPCLNPQKVQEVVQGHLKGDRNYTTEINKLLTLELIHRHFLDVR